MIENPNTQPRGFSANGLRAWGLLFVLLGAAGQGILENRILGLGQMTGQALLEAMEADPDMMGLVGLAIMARAMQTCAVPLFAMLTVEGFLHTRDLKRYLLRVLGMAVLSEIPYNLLSGGSWLDVSSRNPAFGVALALGMLYVMGCLQGKKLLQAAIFLGGLAWTWMLGIREGACLLILVEALWLLRDKPNFRTLGGVGAGVLCGAVSPYYLLCPMAFLAIHNYNGTKGDQSPWVIYLAYPGILAGVALAAAILG